MSAHWIVKHFDVIEYVLSGFVSVFVCFALDPFTFKKLKEAFGNGVVIAVTTSAHAAYQDTV
jgi:hypothetical protein